MGDDTQQSGVTCATGYNKKGDGVTTKLCDKDAGRCTRGRCCVPPTCSDGIQNQGEAEVDCGGPNCAACRTCAALGANEGLIDAQCSNDGQCGHRDRKAETLVPGTAQNEAEHCCTSRGSGECYGTRRRV